MALLAHSNFRTLLSGSAHRRAGPLQDAIAALVRVFFPHRSSLSPSLLLPSAVGFLPAGVAVCHSPGLSHLVPSFGSRCPGRPRWPAGRPGRSVRPPGVPFPAPRNTAPRLPRARGSPARLALGLARSSAPLLPPLPWRPSGGFLYWPLPATCRPLPYGPWPRPLPGAIPLAPQGCLSSRLSSHRPHPRCRVRPPQSLAQSPASPSALHFSSPCGSPRVGRPPDAGLRALPPDGCGADSAFC